MQLINADQLDCYQQNSRKKEYRNNYQQNLSS